jgi:hypothetical protein
MTPHRPKSTINRQKEEVMNLAHARVGNVRYNKSTKAGFLDYSADLLLGAFAPDFGALLSVVAHRSATVVQGLRAVLQAGEYVSVRLPAADLGREFGSRFPKDKPVFSHVSNPVLAPDAGPPEGGDEAAKPLTKRARRASRKRRGNGVHLLTTFVGFDAVSKPGFIPVLTDRPQEFAHETARRLNLPMLPHWSGYFMARVLEQPDMTLPCLTANCDGTILKLDQAAAFRILREGLRSGRLTHEEDAPAGLKKWTVRPFGERVRDRIRKALDPGNIDLGLVEPTDEATVRYLEDVCVTVDEVLYRHRIREIPEDATEVRTSVELPSLRGIDRVVVTTRIRDDRIRTTVSV